MRRPQRAVAAIMTSLSLAIALPAAAQTVPAPAATVSPEALTLSRTIVDAAFPPERREQMIDRMMRTMMEQMRGSMPFGNVEDAGLKRIFDDYMNRMPTILRPATVAFLPRQMDALAHAYARMFSITELKDIAAFSQSPSGRTYLQRSTDVLSDPAVAAVNTQYFTQAQGVTQKAVGELVEKVSAYLKEHPDVAGQIGQAKAQAE